MEYTRCALPLKFDGNNFKSCYNAFLFFERETCKFKCITVGLNLSMITTSHFLSQIKNNAKLCTSTHLPNLGF